MSNLSRCIMYVCLTILENGFNDFNESLSNVKGFLLKRLITPGVIHEKTC